MLLLMRSANTRDVRCLRATQQCAMAALQDTATLGPCASRPASDRRRAALLPRLAQMLKTEAQALALSARTLVSARLAAWDPGFPFPLAQARVHRRRGGRISGGKGGCCGNQRRRGFAPPLPPAHRPLPSYRQASLRRSPAAG